MSDEYYGLVAVILSAAMILYPFYSFGMNASLVKFYSSFKNDNQKNSFLSFVILFPIISILISLILFYFFKSNIVDSLNDGSKLIEDFLIYIIIVGISLGYFEIFYSFARVRLKSVMGNVLKEVSIRVMVSILLCLIYFEIISPLEFIQLLTASYVLRSILMMFLAIYNSGFKLGFSSKLPIKQILIYSSFVISTASVSLMVLEIDKLMLSQYIDLSNVAYYAVGGFIGIVVSVPGRSLVQILEPLVSKALNENDIIQVGQLFKKSSINLTVISGFVFLMIVVNIKFLYTFLPEKFSGGELVAIVIAFGKLFDMFSGITGTIIKNSKFFKYDFVMGLMLLIILIGSNVLLIPEYGLIGASIATALSLVIYNVLKLFVIKINLNIHPFTIKSFIVLAVVLLLSLAFYFVDLELSPILSMIVLSLISTIVYAFCIYLIKPSKEVIDLFNHLISNR
jgi:O-antigen/teichoic acid export membrane protein